MQAASAQFTAFAKSQIQTPAAFVKVQLPTADGSRVASQLIFSNLTGLRLTKASGNSSDSASFTLVDNDGTYSSINTKSKFGLALAPGEIDNKFIMYLGYRDTKQNMSLLPMFTGFLETDSQDVKPFAIDKSVDLVDFVQQFRMQVYDTFPHPIYGNQTLSYFDPNYNLTPVNASGGLATQWACDGKMFTQSKTDKFYGTTHADPMVFVDPTGTTPQATPVTTTSWTITSNVGSCANWTFDYHNGIVTFTTAYLTSIGYTSAGIPVASKVSLAGNPTYMAPEVMIRKILVEKAGWSPNFLKLDTTNVLLPQFQGNDQSAWTCIGAIASMTNPRFVPWKVSTTGIGVVKFYESNVDSPPVATYVDERDFLSCQYINTARDIRTVVRADSSVTTSAGSNQPITSIAYDLGTIQHKGLTEPFTINQNFISNIAHLTVTQAVNYLDMITTSALAGVSHPTLSLQVGIWPNYALEVDDTVRVRSKRTGKDAFFAIKQIDINLSAAPTTGSPQSLQLQEYVDTVNYLVGVPGGVTTTGQAVDPAVVGPTMPIIGAVKMGTGANLLYPYQYGQYINDSVTGKPVVPCWNAADLSGMHFDVFLNSAPQSIGSSSPVYQYGTNNLPPGYGWTQSTDSNGKIIYYGTAPASPQSPLTVGQTVACTSDSVFYYFSHAAPMVAADMSNVWIPTGNATPPSGGGSQGYTGQASSVYLWRWWYLCLDSNLGTGKNFRLAMRNDAAHDATANAVSATGGLWVNNLWTAPPGPVFTSGPYSTIGGLLGALGGPTTTFVYGNQVCGITDYTATPAGFAGANVMGAGVNFGVAYGPAVPNSAFYVGQQKKTRGRYCILAANNLGAVQFLQLPFTVTF